MNSDPERGSRLPTRRNLKLVYAVSFIIAIVMAAASVGGLVYGADLYPTDDLHQALVPTDVVNLVLGLPILLGSMWLAWRGKLVGLLLWPGALLFVFYNYLAYVLAMPLNVAFLLHLTLVMLSAYTLIGLLASIDGESVQGRLSGSVPERLAGGIVAGLGFLFFLRAAGVLAGAIASQTPMAGTELAPNVADLLIAPAWVIGGVLLWRREAFGYVSGLGLLFSVSMLFIGLIVLILGLIGFVPFALFVRGVVSGR